MGGDLSVPREPSGSIPVRREVLTPPETNQQIHLCPASQGAAPSTASVVCQSRDGKHLWLQLHTRAEKPGIYSTDCLACSHFAEGITRHTKTERFRTGSAHRLHLLYVCNVLQLYLPPNHSCSQRHASARRGKQGSTGRSSPTAFNEMLSQGHLPAQTGWCLHTRGSHLLLGLQRTSVTSITCSTWSPSSLRAAFSLACKGKRNICNTSAVSEISCTCRKNCRRMAKVRTK